MNQFRTGRRQKGLKSSNQLRGEIPVTGKVREGERSIPGADLGTNNLLRVLMRAGNEMLRHPFADLLGRKSGRKMGEIFLLPEGEWSGQQPNANDPERQKSGPP